MTNMTVSKHYGKIYGMHFDLSLWVWSLRSQGYHYDIPKHSREISHSGAKVRDLPPRLDGSLAFSERSLQSFWPRLKNFVSIRIVLCMLAISGLSDGFKSQHGVRPRPSRYRNLGVISDTHYTPIPVFGQIFWRRDILFSKSQLSQPYKIAGGVRQTERRKINLMRCFVENSQDWTLSNAIKCE